MNKKKEGFIIIIATVLTFGVPIQTWADSNDSLVSNDVVFFDERDFEGIVEQILNIKSEHPEWMEQQVEDAMDVNAPGKSAMRSGIIDIWNSLTDSEKKLVIRYPFDALKVNQAKNIATTQTETKFGVNGLGNKSDAFRHGIWNAEMTYLIGKTKAELFATAHEDKDVSGKESDGFLKTEHKNMDLHNNEVGRILAMQNPGLTEDAVANLIYSEVNKEKSSFIWLHE